MKEREENNVMVDVHAYGGDALPLYGYESPLEN